MKEEITNEKEARLYVLGLIAGLNEARIRFWGFGYDNDDTGREIRQYTTQRINELKELIEIQDFGDTAFSSVKDLLKK